VTATYVDVMDTYIHAGHAVRWARSPYRRVDRHRRQVLCATLRRGRCHIFALPKGIPAELAGVLYGMTIASASFTEEKGLVRAMLLLPYILACIPDTYLLSLLSWATICLPAAFRCRAQNNCSARTLVRGCNDATPPARGGTFV